MKRIHQVTKNSTASQIIDLFMGVRTLLFAGSHHYCPCCGWSLRTFTRGGYSWRPRPKGYCPRCNSKPRHRWLWMYLKENTDLFSAPLRVLHVSPSHSISYSMRKLSNLSYTSGDLNYRPHIHLKFDLCQSPFGRDTFDALICIHVLEHVENDCAAIHDMFRLLKPGGWAIIAVPIRMDSKTLEDPTITSPEERKKVFGEIDHVRFYGYDLLDRLQSTGFQVQTFYARDLEPHTIEKYGLKAEEVMFHCTKPYLNNGR